MGITVALGAATLFKTASNFAKNNPEITQDLKKLIHGATNLIKKLADHPPSYAQATANQPSITQYSSNVPDAANPTQTPISPCKYGSENSPIKNDPKKLYDALKRTAELAKEVLDNNKQQYSEQGSTLNSLQKN